jgi:hypothetical protein
MRSSSSAGEDLIHRKLVPGERLAWIGQPDRSIHLTDADGFLIPFSLVWSAISFYGFLMVYEPDLVGFRTAANLAIGPYAVSACMAVVGVYLMIGRFAYKRCRKGRTWYALTTHRAIVLRRTLIRAFDYLWYSSDLAVTASCRVSGAGDLHFVESGPADRWPTGFLGKWSQFHSDWNKFVSSNTGLDFAYWVSSSRELSMFDIRNLPEVESLTRRLCADAAGRA